MPYIQVLLVKILKAPFIILGDLLRMVVVYLPGASGFLLRRLYYRNKFYRMGRNVLIDVGVLIDGAQLISIGDNVLIDRYCIISTGKELNGKITEKGNADFIGQRGELIIGNNVHIVQYCIIMAYGGVHINDNCTLSSGTKIYSLSNLYRDPENPRKVISIMPYKDAPFLIAPVTLNENVWVGLNCILMPGTALKRNTFVVSNSLVKGRFPENSYLSGQPAKRIRARFE